MRSESRVWGMLARSVACGGPIRGGAKTEAADERGWTALHHATAIPDIEMAKASLHLDRWTFCAQKKPLQVLLEEEANIEARDDKGRELLLVAVK